MQELLIVTLPPLHEETTYEFLSYRSLENCIERLEGLRKIGILASTKVTFETISQDRVQYQIKRWYAFRLLGEISGELISEKADVTLVYGEAIFSIRIYIYSIIVFIVAIVSLLVSLQIEGFSPVFYLCLVPLVVLIHIVHLYRVRNRLFTLVQDTLRY